VCTAHMICSAGHVRRASRQRRRQGDQQNDRERGRLHRASRRPMYSRIMAIALSVSALAWPMKP